MNIKVAKLKELFKHIEIRDNIGVFILNAQYN